MLHEQSKRVVHEIWEPAGGWELHGLKIAIVGYSHYHGEGQEDRDSLTREVVQHVIDGKEKHAFFRSIMEAFGYNDPASFWDHVCFFNYLPRSVGTPDKKYVSGSEADIEEAKARFRRFLEEKQPDKVFVFTRKGWTAFPETTNEELGGGVCNVLVEGSKTTWGTYEMGGNKVLVCGFQHPQYARKARLRDEVEVFLRL